MIHLFTYLIHLGDNALAAGQRNAEWTGHGPVLEQDIAITNISLDLIGQARNFYQRAAGLYNEMNQDERKLADHLLPATWKNFNRELEEDDLAMLRDERQYLNLLITELPRGDWSFSILRQFFFSCYQYFLYQQLMSSANKELAGIAEKSFKEVSYHLRWSAEWVIRLGDGTAESNGRINKSLDELWMYTGEMFEPAAFETELQKIAADLHEVETKWKERVQLVFAEAGLDVPAHGWHQSGGKAGIHTEHMGYMLAELQYLQRAYPDAKW